MPEFMDTMLHWTRHAGPRGGTCVLAHEILPFVAEESWAPPMRASGPLD